MKTIVDYREQDFNQKQTSSQINETTSKIGTHAVKIKSAKLHLDTRKLSSFVLGRGVIDPKFCLRQFYTSRP